MSQLPEFRGFTPETIQFLRDLKENNYKEWFEEHRMIYEEELLSPFKSLIATLAPTMHGIDSTFELRPNKVLSRIYRDVRFSKEKTPYKTGLWMTFQIPVSRETWVDYPGFFFDLNDQNYTYGMGLAMPKKKSMDGFRDAIVYDAEEFRRITQKTVLDRGLKINGEDYKRLLVNDLPEYFQPWMQKKGVWVGKEMPIGDELYSSAFAEQLREDFTALEWLYKFMKNSID